MIPIIILLGITILLLFIIYNQTEYFEYPINVFWTGGFDSTFLICFLLNQGKTVQPIYIFDSKVDGTNVTRENKQIEIQTMTQLTKQLRKYFTNGMLLDLEIVSNVNVNYEKEWVIKCMQELFEIGVATRVWNQYTSMGIYSLEQNKIINVGTEGKKNGAVSKYILPYLENDRIISGPSGYKLWKNLRFPLANLSKQDMLKKAQKEGWDKILYQTFSCWFPVNGKPCGNCQMCSERII